MPKITLNITYALLFAAICTLFAYLIGCFICWSWWPSDVHSQEFIADLLRGCFAASFMAFLLTIFLGVE